MVAMPIWQRPNQIQDPMRNGDHISLEETWWLSKAGKTNSSSAPIVEERRLTLPELVHGKNSMFTKPVLVVTDSMKVKTALPSKTQLMVLGFQIEEAKKIGFPAKEVALVHGKNGQVGLLQLPGELRALPLILEEVHRNQHHHKFLVK